MSGLVFVYSWAHSTRFHMAIKSAVSTLVTKLGQQAKLFLPEKVHHHRLIDNAEIYNEIQSRIDEVSGADEVDVGYPLTAAARDDERW